MSKEISQTEVNMADSINLDRGFMSKSNSTTHHAIEAVTFDVTGTLIYAPNAAEIYSSILAKHGVEASQADIARLIQVVWTELACRAESFRDRFSAASGGAAGWWRGFVERLCLHLGYDHVSRFATAELYHRFSLPESWSLYPETETSLRLLQERGLCLGIIANWDPRLPPLLAGLGLLHFFDVVVTSSECGVEKPHPKIFRSCLTALDILPSQCLHCGDRMIEDVEGARAVGMRAVLIDRSGGIGPKPTSLVHS